MKKYLQKNLQKGYIVPNKVLYSSFIFFAFKANGDLRFYIDYRKLNAITKRNRYPLPLIDEIIEKIMGYKYFIRFDIITAFNKLRMHPDSEDYITFVIIWGAYKYKILFFGLINGPASFQQYINDILQDYFNIFCQIYLDDILVYSKTKKEHRKHILLIFDKLKAAGLQINVYKYEFDVKETIFLGIIISGEGLRIDLRKIKAIQKQIIFINFKQVQRFFGFANFYRRFIKGFSKSVALLVQLTKKDFPFI